MRCRRWLHRRRKHEVIIIVRRQCQLTCWIAVPEERHLTLTTVVELTLTTHLCRWVHRCPLHTRRFCFKPEALLVDEFARQPEMPALPGLLRPIRQERPMRRQHLCVRLEAPVFQRISMLEPPPCRSRQCLNISIVMRRSSSNLASDHSLGDVAIPKGSKPSVRRGRGRC